MDDHQRAPGDGDRRQVSDRIKKAVAEGRISSADGEIRLSNVSSAASMAEIALITRDLDQLEAVLPARAAEPVPQAAWTATSQADVARKLAVESSGRTVPLLILGLVVALLAAGGIGLVVYKSSGDKSETGTAGPELTDPITSDPTSTGRPVDVSSPVVPADGQQTGPFKLSAFGVKSFISTYQHKFSTTKVTDLTMYGDYLVVQVPVAGKHRHSGWLYRDGQWSDFGGVSADFPGSATIDLRKLNVNALMRNLAKARRSLKVEDISQNYVVINYRPQFDDAPNVNIYVSNGFHETGYLATTLSGAVERSYPYSAS